MDIDMPWQHYCDTDGESPFYYDPNNLLRENGTSALIYFNGSTVSANKTVDPGATYVTE